MQDKDTMKSTLNQFFEELSDQELLEKLCKELGVDKYVKKLTLDKLLALIALAQLREYKGLREISSCLNDEEISTALNLDSIHFSTISRRLASVSTEVLETVFLRLRNECMAKIGLNATEDLLGRLHLIDSSTISLCVTKYGWAEFRKTKGGIKVHLRIRVHNDGVIPDKMVMTPAKPADRTQMDELVVTCEGDAINVFDRGYFDLKQFDHYCDNGILFVTRLKENAIVEVMTELNVNPESVIKRDAIVFLGKNHRRMQHLVRLIETEDTEGNPIKIITNVTDLAAVELADAYRHRWKIELFFKWIKQHLKVKHFFGTSSQAVENQLYIALITFCVLRKLQKDSGFTGTLLELTRILLACLHGSFSDFLAKLLRRPKRSSRGRRILNHDLIFEHTYEQVMMENIDFLYDSTYDPIIL
ncbi:MAG TPA: IS4 family transposase [Bacilli bacterium]|nr:IS4 family transposase [Bacilli bacterium]